MSHPGRSSRHLLATGFFIGNLVSMVLISCLVKLLADRYPVNQILLFRFALAAAPLLAVTLFLHGRAALRTRRPRDHAIRTICGISSLTMFYFALALIPMAEATMLAYSSPLFIAVLSIPILGERIGLPRWSAVVMGFIGVMIVVQPGSAIFSLGGLAALGSGFVAAFVVIWLRMLNDTEHPGTISFFYNGSGALVFIIWVLAAGWTPIQSLFDWSLFIAIGLIGSVQQYLLTLSLRHGEASFIAPLEYLILVFAALAGLVFWNEIPPLTSLLGGLVIIASGLLLAYRERVKRARAGV